MTMQMNTLFVSSDGAFLRKEHESVVVEVHGEKKAQVPMLHLASIVVLGRGMVSPELMGALTEANVHIAYLSPAGRFLARVEGVPGGNVLLRREQYRAADNAEKTREIARAVVAGKAANARQFLLHARRDVEDAVRRQTLADAAERIALLLEQLKDAGTTDSIRGFEGMAAKEYFGAFNALIKRDEPELAFGGRTRNPPKDRINTCLSFGYALLMQDCAASACAVGLDPAVGFLHDDRPGRLSLALDLMEELRTPVVDRLVLALINRGQLGPGDFQGDSAGGWRLSDAARKTFLVKYQEAKQEEVKHPFLEQTAPWGRVPFLQALLLARTIRGDLPAYPPFAIR
jgi:CRISPR-associated protein Cas1